MTHTIAYPNLSNTFLFEKSLDERVIEVINKYSNSQQTLIFCSSKKSSETLAKLISNRANRNHITLSPEEHHQIATVSDSLLKQLVRKGFAYHHAGLPPDDRATVEKLYIRGQIQILCSTSTLAHGMNLPAHLVIIKGTNSWRGGSRGYERMSKSEIIQMIGRAGRPGFDTEGVAVIMTSIEDKSFFDGTGLSADVVESTIITKLTEGNSIYDFHRYNIK